ncbi:hypothetical protein M758_UG170800 [Ceratodon purpureus]|nr:hypothetical protein M758_UG170800 [Ceratodon purpureus]
MYKKQFSRISKGPEGTRSLRQRTGHNPAPDQVAPGRHSSPAPPPPRTSSPQLKLHVHSNVATPAAVPQSRQPKPWPRAHLQSSSTIATSRCAHPTKP